MRTVAQALKGHPAIMEHYLNTRYDLHGISNKQPLNIVKYSASMGNGGFLWVKSKDGHRFWRDLLVDGKFTIYYEKYGKTEHQKTTELDDLMDSLKVRTLDVTK